MISKEQCGTHIQVHPQCVLTTNTHSKSGSLIDLQTVTRRSHTLFGLGKVQAGINKIGVEDISVHTKYIVACM